MLSAERLCELPLEVRVYIGNMNMETYIRMYLWDDEFRDYANRECAVNDFIERFVVTRKDGYTIYRINNIEYRKYDNGSQEWYMNGKLHREDGPAVICYNGSHSYFLYDLKHRSDGPALIDVLGGERWYNNDKLHRLDGPARISANGDKWWYIDDKLHRDDGPAVMHASGYKAYFHHDRRHRLDGPAIIHVDGSEEYWEYGVSSEGMFI